MSYGQEDKNISILNCYRFLSNSSSSPKSLGYHYDPFIEQLKISQKFEASSKFLRKVIETAKFGK